MSVDMPLVNFYRQAIYKLLHEDPDVMMGYMERSGMQSGWNTAYVWALEIINGARGPLEEKIISRAGVLRLMGA